MYRPPAFFWWWFAYDAHAHEIFVTGGFIAGAGGVAAFVVAVPMSVWRARDVKNVTTYGSACWARGARDSQGGASPSRGCAAGPLARRLSPPSWTGAVKPRPAPLEDMRKRELLSTKGVRARLRGNAAPVPRELPQFICVCIAATCGFDRCLHRLA